MSNLLQARQPREENWKTVALPLAAGQKVFRGGRAVVDVTNHQVVKMASGTAGFKSIGEFQEDVDNSAGSNPVNVLVSLDNEIVIRFYDNATGGSAISTTATGTGGYFFATAYMLDDHTVTATAGSNGTAGRVWFVTADGRVGVQALSLNAA